jgi:hypothetical protein
MELRCPSSACVVLCVFGKGRGEEEGWKHERDRADALPAPRQWQAEHAVLVAAAADVVEAAVAAVEVDGEAVWPQPWPPPTPRPPRNTHASPRSRLSSPTRYSSSSAHRAALLRAEQDELHKVQAALARQLHSVARALARRDPARAPRQRHSASVLPGHPGTAPPAPRRRHRRRRPMQPRRRSSSNLLQHAYGGGSGGGHPQARRCRRGPGTRRGRGRGRAGSRRRSRPCGVSRPRRATSRNPGWT